MNRKTRIKTILLLLLVPVLLLAFLLIFLFSIGPGLLAGAIYALIGLSMVEDNQPDRLFSTMKAPRRFPSLNWNRTHTAKLFLCLMRISLPLSGIAGPVN